MHHRTFSNANGGTFRPTRRETSRGQNQPNGVPKNASALHAGVMPLMPLVYPSFGTGLALYILPAAAICLDDMLSSPLEQHILDYEPPRGFIMPTIAMFNGSNDPYDHMLHYNQAMTLNASNDHMLCKVILTSLQVSASLVP